VGAAKIGHWEQLPSFGWNSRHFAALSQAYAKYFGFSTIVDQLILRKESVFLALNMAAGQTLRRLS
jgi:hypothetical protein